MALSLGVSAGSKIRVGEHTVTVVEVVRDNLMTLQVGNGPPFMVSDAERTEILPKVFVSCGTSQGVHAANGRLAFEAPRQIQINRIEKHEVQ